MRKNTEEVEGTGLLRALNARQRPQALLGSLAWQLGYVKGFCYLHMPGLCLLPRGASEI